MKNEHRNDLEAAVRLVRTAGFATGHADNFEQLIAELLDQVKKRIAEVQTELVRRNMEFDDVRVLYHEEVMRIELLMIEHGVLLAGREHTVEDMVRAALSKGNR